MKPCLIIFGFGYTAAVLTKKLSSLGFNVIGTTSRHKIKQLNLPSSVTLLDFDDSRLLNYLKHAQFILSSVPPNQNGEDSVLKKYAQAIQGQASTIKWIGYLSSTGVYGDHQGQWVNETTHCNPKGTAGLNRLKSEKEWHTVAVRHSLPLHIFRLSGIYGPGRSAIDRIIQGKKHSLFKANHLFSRIHVEDIASIIYASMINPDPFQIYNVADDEPEASHIVDAFAAQLIRHPALPLIDIEQANLSEREKEFYANNRRISNLKLKKELNIILQYPNYRVGLEKIWKETLAGSLGQV